MDKPIDKSDHCAHCGTLLNTCEEIHAVEGILYCSKECAIYSRINEMVLNAKECASEWYNDCAEIVSPNDIGLGGECNE